MSSLTPREIVQELDKHIVGQDAAKRAVAIALRNRWRRMQIPEPLRQEITPKNILMIGPTGVGKTEIARRLARLANAPFVKVEATKFTEVGYVGRDVDSIVKELADVAVKMTREQEMDKVRQRAAEAAEDRVLDALLPKPRMMGFSTDEPAQPRDAETREKFRRMLRAGELAEREIEIELRAAPMGVEIMAPPGMEEMQQQLQSMFQNLAGSRTRSRKVKVSEAMKLLIEDEASNLINEEELKIQALANAEQNGIVFIDEIDKVTRRQETMGADVSREGVQRDLLPLVEGSTVTTKYGPVKTDHVLFIASGAFSSAWRTGRAARACPSMYTRICSATRSPRTCSSRARNCAGCRSCSGTPTSPRRRFTPILIFSTSPASTTQRIRGRAASPEAARSVPLPIRR